MRSYSFFPAVRNRGFPGRFRGLTDGRFGPQFELQIAIPRRKDPNDAYSAAPDNEAFTATNDGFRFAADIMKSQMRGTISDLNREPLNTP